MLFLLFQLFSFLVQEKLASLCQMPVLYSPYLSNLCPYNPPLSFLCSWESSQVSLIPIFMKLFKLRHEMSFRTHCNRIYKIITNSILFGPNYGNIQVSLKCKSEKISEKRYMLTKASNSTRQQTYWTKESIVQSIIYHEKCVRFRSHTEILWRLMPELYRVECLEPGLVFEITVVKLKQSNG